MVASESLDAATTKDISPLALARLVKLALIAFTTTLLAAPFAAAGEMEASFSYLEGEQRCGGGWHEGSGANDSGDWGYWYSYSSWASSCADGFSYARASLRDDEGEVASASADASSSQSSWGSRSESGWWQRGNDSSYSSWSQGEWSGSESQTRRSANLSTREGSAGAAYGCGSFGSQGHQASGHHAYRPEEGSSGRYDHWSSSHGWSRCGADAGAQRGSTGLRATPFESRCEGGTASSSTSEAYYGNGSSYEQQRDHFVSEGECRQGAGAQAGEAAADAGYVDGCRYSEHHFRSRSGGEENFTGWRYVAHECRQGLLVNGPDGMALFVGRQGYEYAECEDESPCGEWESHLVVSLEWAHNPLGPFAPGPVLVPLP